MVCHSHGAHLEDTLWAKAMVQCCVYVLPWFIFPMAFWALVSFSLTIYSIRGVALWVPAMLLWEFTAFEVVSGVGSSGFRWCFYGNLQHSSGSAVALVGSGDVSMRIYCILSGGHVKDLPERKYSCCSNIALWSAMIQSWHCTLTRSWKYSVVTLRFKPPHSGCTGEKAS